MFWFIRKKLVGSNLRFIRYSRSNLFSPYLAVALAPRRITANAICAGITNDSILNKLPAPALAAMLEWLRSGWNPTGRAATPADIGGAVALCSDDAEWITGQTIVADGGASLMNPEVPLFLQKNCLLPLNPIQLAPPQFQADMRRWTRPRLISPAGPRSRLITPQNTVAALFIGSASGNIPIPVPPACFRSSYLTLTAGLDATQTLCRTNSLRHTENECPDEQDQEWVRLGDNRECTRFVERLRWVWPRITRGDNLTS